MSDWSRDRLLSRHRRLEGPRPVTTRVRPTRIAYLIDPLSIDVALAAISGACLEWGGQFNFLIPCVPGERPDESWSTILHRFDPDLILDLVDADADFISEQTVRYGRPTRRWQDPLSVWQPGRTSVFSSLDMWKAKRPATTNYKLAYFTNLGFHVLSLPIAFEYGNLNGNPIAPNFELVRSWPDSVKHRDFIPTQAVDINELSDDEIVDLVSSSSGGVPFRLERLESGMTQQYTLIDLTTLGIATREPSYQTI